MVCRRLVLCHACMCPLLLAYYIYTGLVIDVVHQPYYQFLNGVIQKVEVTKQNYCYAVGFNPKS